MEKPQLPDFQFDSKLDTDYLKYFYGEDVEYAADIFQAFLTYSIPEYRKIKPLIESDNWTDARHIAHKLRPKFPMVGLTGLESKMSDILKAVKNESAKTTLLTMLESFEKELEIYLPILREDLKKMNNSLL